MSVETAQIVVNGQQREIKLPCMLTGLLAEAGWKPTQVVVEHNGRVVPRSEAGSVSLSDGDQLEIILPVAGG
jgi:thiamine biosynthesis protein ThiS